MQRTNGRERPFLLSSSAERFAGATSEEGGSSEGSVHSDADRHYAAVPRIIVLCCVGEQHDPSKEMRDNSDSYGFRRTYTVKYQYISWVCFGAYMRAYNYIGNDNSMFRKF